MEAFVAQVLERRSNHDTFLIDLVEAREWPDLHERFGVASLPTLIVVEDTACRRGSRSRGAAATSNASSRPWLR